MKFLVWYEPTECEADSREEALNIAAAIRPTVGDVEQVDNEQT